MGGSGACGSSCYVFVILDKAEWAAKCSTSWCASASHGASVGHPIVIKALCGECGCSLEVLVLLPPSGGSFQDQGCADRSFRHCCMCTCLYALCFMRFLLRVSVLPLRMFSPWFEAYRQAGKDFASHHIPRSLGSCGVFWLPLWLRCCLVMQVRCKVGVRV